MEVGRIILEQIGVNNLLCIAARDYKFGRGNKVSHCGYLEFTASENPKLPQEVRVRIELRDSDTYTLIVTDTKTKQTLEEIEDIYEDNLFDVLDEIFG
ncbi:hypothetical protein [Sulfuricurvum sp.]|uniref:hypothetical protein n=1 Tax=Sulfuricurvum sp. TaxID=2025608 RepID=UPI002613A0DB|nr:hypothetical protein [Sulfuricurvum sp.]MDD3597442.1 hypothetical protein [Sulfuricurvum sp.]